MKENKRLSPLDLLIIITIIVTSLLVFDLMTEKSFNTNSKEDNNLFELKKKNE